MQRGNKRKILMHKYEHINKNLKPEAWNVIVLYSETGFLYRFQF